LERRICFNDKYKNKERKGILLLNIKSLWDAFKIDNNRNIKTVPQVVFKNNIEVDTNTLSNKLPNS
jgi:hypothetical protein